jgi:hypothetical protein
LLLKNAATYKSPVDRPVLVGDKNTEQLVSSSENKIAGAAVENHEECH